MFRKVPGRVDIQLIFIEELNLAEISLGDII